MVGHVACSIEHLCEVRSDSQVSRQRRTTIFTLTPVIKEASPSEGADRFTEHVERYSLTHLLIGQVRVPVLLERCYPTVVRSLQ